MAREKEHQEIDQKHHMDYRKQKVNGDDTLKNEDCKDNFLHAHHNTVLKKVSNS